MRASIGRAAYFKDMKRYIFTAFIAVIFGFSLSGCACADNQSAEKPIIMQDDLTVNEKSSTAQDDAVLSTEDDLHVDEVADTGEDTGDVKHEQTTPPMAEFTFKAVDGVLSLESVISGELTEIIIPAESDGVSVVKISANALKNCRKVKKIVIPESVIIIEAYAFYGCRALESVIFESGAGDWLVGKYTVKGSVLDKPNIAATYLKQTFSDLIWTRQAGN